MIANTAQQRRQIVFPDAEVVVMLRSRDFAAGFETILVHLFENWFLGFGSLGFWISGFGFGSWCFGRALDGFAVRHGGRAQFRRWRALLKFRVEPFDLRFERGNLVAERARAV